MVTSTLMNTYIRDDFDALSLHTHTGAPGDGSNNINTGQTFNNQTNMTLYSNTSPMITVGELRRFNDELRYHNVDVVLLTSDGIPSMGSVRTLGTGANQAAAGNHTHP
ncbi:hypothetical protein CL653_02090 [bacterium]|nr:hypothetical protein [bacterium]